MKSKENKKIKVNLTALKEIKADDIANGNVENELKIKHSKKNKDKKIENENVESVSTNAPSNEKPNVKDLSKTEKPVVTKVKLTKKQEFTNSIKFALFSISAGVIQMLSFTLLSELIFHDADNEYGVSYFISLALSVLWNFTFNRKFTFKSAKNVPLAMMLVFIYYCAFTPLSIWWGVELVDNLGWNSYLVLFITMVINMATEYIWTRYVVYRDDINTAKTKEKTKDTKIDNQLKKQSNKSNLTLDDSNTTPTNNNQNSEIK